MAIRLSTAGILLYYAVETTAGTRPTAESDYKQIHEIKSIPELNPEPDNLETTTLEETVWKTYIPGLKDIGGALTFVANLTDQLMEEWEALMTAFNAGQTASTGLDTWFKIYFPKLKKDLYFTGEPSPIGMPGAEVSAVLETNLFITPTNAPEWNPKTPAAGGVSV